MSAVLLPCNEHRDAPMHPSSSAISNLPLGQQDLARAIVEGFLTGRVAIAVISAPGVQSKPLMDAVLDVLADKLTRIVKVEETSMSRLGPPIATIDQLLEGGEVVASDMTGSDAPTKPLSPIDLGQKMLGCRPSGERRRLLVIETVHLLSSDAFEQLACLTEAGPPELPLQMLLLGDADYWYRLQGTKFENLRQRIGVPLMILPSLGSEETSITGTRLSNTQLLAQQQARRVRRPGRVWALIILLGAILIIFGLLRTDSELRDQLLTLVSPVWAAFVDRLRRLTG